MNFNTAAALKNGVSQTAIDYFQKQSQNFNFAQAQKDGYTGPQITDWLMRDYPGESSGNWNQFVSTASQIAKNRNFPLGVLLGQAAIESGRGSSGLTTQANNYFGMKGAGSAGSINMPTQEYSNGSYKNENSNFAAYKSPEDSINSYINLIRNNYGITTNNPNEMINQIEQNGYATSPTYVQEVTNTPEFKQYGGSQ